VVDEGVSKYLPSFVKEGKQMLVLLKKNLDKVNNGDESKETLFELYRLSHSLKSSALTVNLFTFAEAAEIMEEALSSYGEDIPPQWDDNLVTLIDFSILNLENVFTMLESGVTPDYDELKNEMETIWLSYNQLNETEKYSADDKVEFDQNIHSEKEEDDSKDLDDVVADFFIIEAKEHLETLQKGFLDLEKNPTDKEIIENVFRAAHTLKGAASSVGFSSTEHASHAIEDTLEPVREGEVPLTPGTIDILLSSYDALNQTFTLECDKDPKSIDVAKEVATALSNISGKQTEFTPSQTQVFYSDRTSDRVREESVSVRLPKLDNLMVLAGELLVQQSRMSNVRERLSDLTDMIRLSLRRMTQLNADLSQQQLISRSTRAMGVGATGDVSIGSRFEDEFDELELDRYTEIDRIVKNEYEIHADLSEALHTLDNQINELARSTDSIRQNVSSIQSSVISTRLTPVNQILSRFPRMVRDLARSEGKLIDLEMYGEDVEVDVRVIRSIYDPLLHIVRNAVHHGIEKPGERVVEGKPKQGKIVIDAKYFGNQVIIRVSNDGRSIDTDRIASEALKMGFVTQDDLKEMTSLQINRLIFLSGLSTTQKGGMIAGRGVGLDVVKASIESIGGSVSLESDQQSTTFTLTLPISLIISQGIEVTVPDHTYIVPIGTVQEVLSIDRSTIEKLGSKLFARIRGELMEIRFLDEALSLKPKIRNQESFPALLIEIGREYSILGLSTIEGRRDIMIRALPVCVRDIPHYTGVTILGAGIVLPVLNLPPIIQKEYHQKELTDIDINEDMLKTSHHNVLVVEDSLSMRKILKMDLEGAGFKILTASTGLEALDIIETENVDSIILDLEMPEMDGYELMSVLREEENLSRIPKMIITSRAGSRHRKKAFELGANAYLIKPYDKQIVLDTLSKMFKDL
jgi:chemosensory pili system protein ChpA (sensor histidine kinase/response regulator)